MSTALAASLIIASGLAYAVVPVIVDAVGRIGLGKQTIAALPHGRIRRALRIRG